MCTITWSIRLITLKNSYNTTSYILNCNNGKKYQSSDFEIIKLDSYFSWIYRSEIRCNLKYISTRMHKHSNKNRWCWGNDRSHRKRSIKKHGKKVDCTKHIHEIPTIHSLSYPSFLGSSLSNTHFRSPFTTSFFKWDYPRSSLRIEPSTTWPLSQSNAKRTRL